MSTRGTHTLHCSVRVEDTPPDTVPSVCCRDRLMRQLDALRKQDEELRQEVAKLEVRVDPQG